MLQMEENEEQPNEYKRLYMDIHFSIEKMKYDNPNPYRTLEEFWGVCKLRHETYAERRAYVNELYNDIIIDLERKKRQTSDPKQWTNTNTILQDELSVVRRQWLKAKNFLLGPNVDYENCIKEATNSIESTLQILLGKPGDTLGKLIKNSSFD